MGLLYKKSGNIHGRSIAMTYRFGPFLFVNLQVSVFLFSVFFYFLFSTKDGAMYLSFLLLTAIIYSRVALFLFRVKQLAMNYSENQTEVHLYIQSVPDCFFREHSLFHIAVSDFFFFISYCKKNNNRVWGGILMKSEVIWNVSIILRVCAELDHSEITVCKLYFSLSRLHFPSF